MISPDLQGEERPRLLVVDDQPTVRMSLRDLLSLKGYEIHEASSGEEALARFEEGSYDLVLLDVRMPGIDGPEVMRHIRKDHPRLPVIILTGHASVDSAIAALKLDAADYLLKPFRVEDLIATVDRVLRDHQERQRRQALLHAMGHALDSLRDTMPLDDAPKSARVGPGPQMGENGREPQRFLRAGSVTLDSQKQVVTVDDDVPRQAKLTERETEVLMALMGHPDEVLSCEELARAATGYESDPQEARNLIRPYVFRLRQKIERSASHPRIIRTVRGRGYFLSIS